MEKTSYNFAYCTVQFRDDEFTMDVIIALKPMDQLGIEESSRQDNIIFFYCENEDEFNGMLDGDGNSDFRILEVKEFFNEL